MCLRDGVIDYFFISKNLRPRLPRRKAHPAEAQTAQASAAGSGYNEDMKTTALLALALLAAAPVFAQDFFGITPNDAQAMIGQVRADEHLQRLKELGRSPSAFPVGKVLGFTKTLTSAQNCIIDAVQAHMGIAEVPYDTQFPDVLFASDVDGSRYQAAVKAQYPASTPTKDVSTIYLPDDSVIYVADAASVYAKGGSVDAALAGQYARFFDWTVRGSHDMARMDADAVEASAWYAAQYPAGRSSCR